MKQGLNELKWRLVRLLGERGRAAAYWAGQKDTRPPGSDALWYDTASLPAPDPRYGSEVREQHLYLTMRDGARIALSLYLPEHIPDGETLPTLLNQTCYWRAYRIKWPFNLLVSGAPYFVRWFVPRGYAYVIVDVRGTGASSGQRPNNRTRTENDDAREIIDWIVAQPWSNGRVGTEGVSYMGASAAMTSAVDHPALKAVVPQFALDDVYEEFVYPGGVLCERIIRRWSDQAVKLQRGLPNNGSWLMGTLVEGVQPVDGDAGLHELNAVLAGHADNGNIYDVVTAARFRDSVLPGVVEDGRPATHEQSTPYAYTRRDDDDGPAFYEIGGWYDGAFLRGNINRHLGKRPGRHKLTIGPWDHGGAQNISPWSNSRRSAASRLFEMLRFFEHHLKDRPSGVYSEPAVHYFTIGEECWKASDNWPPAEAVVTPMHLAPDHALLPMPPQEDAPPDHYTVDYAASSGINNRWQTIANFGHRGKEAFDIEYPDRVAAQARLLTYTSAPLEHDTEVTGHPVLMLYLAASTDDAAIHAYLEDVGPDGDVVYVTEGILRASRRTLAPAPHATAVPWHSHREADARPLVPGQIVELTIPLYATSYLFRRGRRIRLGIAGADADTFEAVPGDGRIPELQIHRTPDHPSRIELPLMPRTRGAS